jgi:hypothetical protein
MKLFLNRSQVCSRLDHLTEAAADCTSAKGVNENYLNIPLLRARCYLNLRDFDSTVRIIKQHLK